MEFICFVWFISLSMIFTLNIVSYEEFVFFASVSMKRVCLGVFISLAWQWWWRRSAINTHYTRPPTITCPNLHSLKKTWQYVTIFYEIWRYATISCDIWQYATSSVGKLWKKQRCNQNSQFTIITSSAFHSQEINDNLWQYRTKDVTIYNSKSCLESCYVDFLKMKKLTINSMLCCIFIFIFHFFYFICIVFILTWM